MAELQAFRLSRQDTSRDREGNFFERGETSGSSPTTITRPGLKDDIRIDVRVKQPKTLSETISVAHLTKERNLLQRKPSSNFCSAMPNYNHRAQPTTIMGLLGPPPTQLATQPTGNKFQGFVFLL
uniref:Uncharacterized protein n=1 Tax=Populus alba TaxID=43335 RepID=A0A4U5QZR4_POPAL|nr:hypothetical protein D5086_0000026720 [Populus alba]